MEKVKTFRYTYPLSPRTITFSKVRLRNDMIPFRSSYSISLSSGMGFLVITILQFIFQIYIMLLERENSYLL